MPFCPDWPPLPAVPGGKAPAGSRPLCTGASRPRLPAVRAGWAQGEGPGAGGGAPLGGEEEVGALSFAVSLRLNRKPHHFEDSTGGFPVRHWRRKCWLPVSSAFGSLLDRQGHWVSSPLKGGNSYLEGLCSVHVFSPKSPGSEP